MKKTVICLLLAGTAAGSFLLGRNTAPGPSTVYSERTDTVRIVTPEVMVIKARNPVRVRLAVADTAGAATPDSATVEVPVQQAVYSGPDYTAYVSGFRPSLDSLVMVRRTREYALPRPTAQKRWSIGIQAGYGITPRGLQPYIGLGVSFRIL